MKKVKVCEQENCIPTLSSCVEWNGGTIDYLGICDGDSLNNIVWEIVTKLEAITGEDLSEFDIDSLLDICNQKAPLEITIISILNLLKNNQVCLKDFIDNLNDRLNELFLTTGVSINLKCYAEFDNLGNSLSITREQLDQLIIDNLCNHKLRIETLEGKVINLQSQIDNIDITPTVDELSFATCVNVNILPTSTQVINTSSAFCDLETATGDDTDIASALSNTPIDLNAEFGLITGWIAVPANWAENYNNLLLEIENLRQRIITIEETCCNVTCEDVKLGFTVIYNEDNTAVILKFTAGAGTDIPVGFLDIGSTIVVTDIDGNTETFVTSNPDLIANNAQIEVSIVGLNLTGDLQVDVDANMSNGSLTCNKCLHKTVKKATCDFCEICNNGPSGTVVVVYDDNGGARAFESFDPTTTTTTTAP